MILFYKLLKYYCNESIIIRTIQLLEHPLFQKKCCIRTPTLEIIIPISEHLEGVQKFALKVCIKNWSSGYESLFQPCNLSTLASRRHSDLKLCLLYQIVNGQLNFHNTPIVPQNLSRSLRNTSTLALERPVTHTNAHQLSFFLHRIPLWNKLPPSAQSCQSLHSFKQTVFCHTLNNSPNT